MAIAVGTELLAVAKDGNNQKKNETITSNIDAAIVDASTSILKFSPLGDDSAKVTGYKEENPTSIDIPSKVKIDGKVYNVKIIGEDAFARCRSLKSISIPESVTSIGDDAFYGCDELPPHLLVYDNGTKCYGWVGDKSKCIEVTIPKSVTSIRRSAFSKCSSLTSVYIPEGVTSIGDWAFGGCGSLTDITIPESVTSIGGLVFYGCDALPPHLLVYNKGTKCYGWVGDKSKCIEVTIPKGVTSIGDWAFYECGSLTNITIPKGVTNIGDWAFEGCKNLDVVIDNKKQNVIIGYGAFNDCKSVKFLK